MQLVQLDMKQISSEAEIYDCLVGQMNFTNADEKPEWMNVIEMNERDPYEMDTEEQPEDPEFKKILETPEKTLDGLVQMLAARLADDYCLEVIRDEAADDEKKELENRSGILCIGFDKKYILQYCDRKRSIGNEATG